jgi:hypothetical protein
MSTAASSASSRLAPARRRARLLKASAAGVAVAGFGILSLVVRSGAHTGGGAMTSDPATSGGGALTLSSRISQEARSSSFFGSSSDSDSSSGSGSVSPSEPSSPPQASTHTS